MTASASQKQTLYNASRKGLITGDQRAQIAAMEGEELEANMIAVEDALKETSFGAELGSKVSEIFSTQVLGMPIWMVVIIVLLFTYSGGEKLVKTALNKTASSAGPNVVAEAFAAGQDVWMSVGDGVVLPINKAPFPKLPFSGLDGRQMLASVLLFLGVLLVIADNTRERPNQAKNHKSNVGILMFFWAATLWSYWAVIFGLFAVYLCLRLRKGNTSKLGNVFFTLVIALWIWFDRLSPIVSDWLKTLTQPGLNWIPKLLEYLFNGENLRPLVAIGLIGFLIWSVVSKKYDSSTLIAVMGFFHLGWYIGTGVFLYWENMPVWMQSGFFIAEFVILIVAIISEQVQVNVVNLPKALVICFSIMFFTSIGFRTFFNIDPGTFWYWLTQPVVVLYIFIAWLSYALGKALGEGNEIVSNVYQMLGSWFGQLVPIFGLAIPGDALMTVNLILVGVLTFTKFVIS